MQFSFHSQVDRLRNYEIGFFEILEPARAFLAEHPYESWSTEQLEDFLYACERDDDEGLYALLGDFWKESDSPAFREHRLRLLGLAQQSLLPGSPEDRRWQLAVQLGRAESFDTEAEALLLRYLEDSHEYVRRQALLSMAKILSPRTEEYAIRAWERKDDMQEYSRWAALEALDMVHSPRYDEFLSLAAASTDQHLGRYARSQRPLPVGANFLSRLRPGSLPSSEVTCRTHRSERELVIISREFQQKDGVPLLTVDCRLTFYDRDFRVPLSKLEPKYQVVLHSMQLHVIEISHFWESARRWLDLPIREIASTPFHQPCFLGYESDILNLRFGPCRNQPQRADYLQLEVTYGNSKGGGKEIFDLDRSCLQNFVEDWERLGDEPETATIMNYT